MWITEEANVATWAILAKTFWDNFLIKSLSATILCCIGKLIEWYEVHLFLMIILYFLDFMLWFILALKLREFNWQKFFRWASKILIYWIFLTIWLSVDTTLHTWTMFIWIMFAFIVVSDSISILRKLHLLGYKTPVFVEKYLISYMKKLEDGWIMKK